MITIRIKPAGVLLAMVLVASTIIWNYGNLPTPSTTTLHVAAAY
jgi:hypothetical protein